MAAFTFSERTPTAFLRLFAPDYAERTAVVVDGDPRIRYSEQSKRCRALTSVLPRRRERRFVEAERVIDFHPDVMESAFVGQTDERRDGMVQSSDLRQAMRAAGVFSEPSSAQSSP